ncbi:MAG: long-chain fatty acid--CoA ligase [Chlorobi bacterium]|nr:long-chain fatty acid--CoA ligase [Chlorobiota bacterium]
MEIIRTFDILDKLKKENDKDDILAAKRDGQWVTFSVDEYIENSKFFSFGLLAKGFKKGDKIATVSNNRPEWNFVDMGMSMVGVIHVPIYPTIGDDEYRYILKHSDAKILIVSDIALYNKLKPIADEIDSIEEVYSFNIIENVPHWSEIVDLGEKEKTKQREEQQKIKTSISPDDVASIIYTSGTTGMPKGVMLTHRNFMSNVLGVAPNFDLRKEDKSLSFLPLCHVFERMVNYLYQYKGCSVYYAENLGTIARDLKDIQASIFTTVPRVIERIYDKLVTKGNDLDSSKKKIFFWAMRLGEKYNVTGRNNPVYASKLKIARKLVFSKWHEAFGGKLRLIISGGAALQPRLSRLFFAAGIPLMEGYGLTETSPVIAVNHLNGKGNLYIGSVGPVLDNIQVKIDEEGEILVKGPSVMKGYYKDEKTTNEVIDSEGWFHTGDIGKLINGKFLAITDRKKEMFKLSNGKYIAPQSIENLFKESNFIEQIMVIGESEKFASAIISPNFEFLHNWAHEHKIHFRDNEDLINDEQVKALYQKEVTRLNKQLGKHEEIKRFRLVCEPWTSAGGELSPTLKLRRRVLYKKYAHIIREIYSYGQNEANRGSISF